MKRTKLLWILQSLLCVALAVLLAAAVIGLYGKGLALKAVDPLSWIFTREKLASALGPVLPLLVMSLVVTVAGLVPGIRGKSGNRTVQEKHAQGEVEAAKAQSRPEKETGIQQQAPRAHQKIRMLRIALLALAACLIVAGVFNGSARDVFGKAVKICSECVGLG